MNLIARYWEKQFEELMKDGRTGQYGETLESFLLKLHLAVQAIEIQSDGSRVLIFRDGSVYGDESERDALLALAPRRAANDRRTTVPSTRARSRTAAFLGTSRLIGAEERGKTMRKNASKNDKSLKGSQTPDRPAVSSGAGTMPTPTPSGGTRLQLPPGEPDLDALRSVTREWLIPRLVERFLQVHGVELEHVGKLANRLQPSLLGAGLQVTGSGPVSEEIKSQAKKKANTGTFNKGGRRKARPRP